MRSSDRLIDLAISPLEEAYRSVTGQSGTGDAAQVLEPINRTLYLAHEIDEDIALAFISTLHRMAEADTKDPITVIVNCLGGDDISGFGMYDAVLAASKQAPVNMEVRGAAMSMAAVILQAATERRIGRNSYFMIHQSWGLQYHHSTKQLEELTRFMRMMEDQATKLWAARSTMSEEEIAERIAATDWYMDAKTAKRLGFVDKVV